MTDPRLLRAWLAGILAAFAGLAPGMASSAAIYDIDTLARAASDRGWNTLRDADGSLLLFPATGTSPESRIVASAPSTPPPSDRLASLEQRLVATGWNVRRDTNGDLLLFPRSNRVSPATEPAPLTAAAGMGSRTARRAPCPDALDRMAAALRERGWSRVERDAQGNLLLFPRTTVPATADSGYTQNDPLGRLARVLSERGWRTARDRDGNLLLFFG